MFKKLKEKKGFTLVELIVVLVILAILAALLISALTGYIDKAKEKSITAETRQTVMAAQTLLDEDYGNAATPAAASDIKTWNTATGAKFTQAETAKLAEVKASNITSVKAEDGKITELVYTDTSVGKKCTYTKSATDGSKGTYKVEDAKVKDAK